MIENWEEFYEDIEKLSAGEFLKITIIAKEV